MGVYRSYFEKNNTILNKSNYNTGKNEVTELVWGNIESVLIDNTEGGDAEPVFSRFLFKIDLSHLQEKIQNGYITKDTIKNHTIKLFNCINPRKKELQGESFNENTRAYGVEVELYELNEEWIEGNGYDFYYDNIFVDNLKSNTTNPSNWYKRNFENDWSTEGVIPTGTTGLTSFYFEKGGENLSLDITDLVNEYLFDNKTNYGLLLKFTDEIEQRFDRKLNILSFFTRHTNTFFEPYLETEYNSLVFDDSKNFEFDTDNKVFIWSKTPITGATVLDDCDKLFKTIPQSGITMVDKDFYYIDLNIPSTYPSHTNFKVIWNEKLLKEFTVFPKNLNFKNVYDNIFYPLPTNLSDNQRIKRGEKIKVNIDIKNIERKLFNKVIPYYRIYTKQGGTEIEIIKKTRINLYDHYFFILETEWLIPKEYHLEIFVMDQYEEYVLPNINTIRFHVLNEKEY